MDVSGPSWTVLERSVKMMLRTSQFFEDVPSEMAIFRHSVKYIKKSACLLLEDVSGETLIFVKIDVAKTPFLRGCLRRNRYFGEPDRTRTGSVALVHQACEICSDVGLPRRYVVARVSACVRGVFCRAPVCSAVLLFCRAPCSRVVCRAPVLSAVLLCGMPCSCVVCRAPVWPGEHRSTAEHRGQIQYDVAKLLFL